MPRRTTDRRSGPKAIGRYRYIHFKRAAEDHAGRPMFLCLNNRSQMELAKVFWYAEWKQFCFTQSAEGVVFNNTCLADIKDFLDKANAGAFE